MRIARARVAGNLHMSPREHALARTAHFGFFRQPGLRRLARDWLVSQAETTR